MTVKQLNVKQLNAMIRNMVTSYISRNGKAVTVDVVDYVANNLSDPRVTRQRICGNISALCCKFNVLNCVDSQLM